jgi:2-keto-4-pentenoate hydratase/2-oxohepta-3-ene-1,7-dioic acid hydratase in catechol pathway
MEHEGSERVVVEYDHSWVDLTAGLGVSVDDLSGFLGQGAKAITQSRRIAKSAARIPVEGARLLAPVRRPDKLLGIGMNYRSAIQAAVNVGMAVPAGKLWFLRPASCIVGPGNSIVNPAGAGDLDFEVELVVVIGRRCSGGSVQDAADAIAGYTIGNDLTLRQRVPKSLVLAKGFASHTPLGPWIVTPDEIGDPQKLRVRAWVNGELRQDSNTSEMVTGCHELVAELSAAFTLLPGDLILTGTPSGSGVFETPQRFLRVGDEVRLEVAGIGSLVNQVAQEDARAG